MNRKILPVLCFIIATAFFHHAKAAEIVQWQEQTAIEVAEDGSVTSTSDASYASHAYSVQTIGADQDGAFEFTQRNVYGLIGLTTTPQGGGYANIDFAIQLWGNNEVYAVELGQQRGLKTTWAAGDVFSVEKKGSTITYLKNGVVFHTSEVAAPEEELYADFAFGLDEHGFERPLISAKEQVEDCEQIVEWQELTEVTIGEDGSVTSTSDASYASHAYSVQTIGADQDGTLEFIQKDVYGLIGLTTTPQGGGYANIDFAIQLWGNNEVYAVELGQQRGLKTSWATGDEFAVKKEDGVIAYLKNGNVFYTSEVAAPEEDLYADFAFGLEGHGFESPKMKYGCPESDFWQEMTEMTTTENGSVTSTSDMSYASHAYSIDFIAPDEDGSFEFTQIDVYGLIGLSTTPQGGGYANIDFAIQLWANNEVYVVELGQQRGLKTTWTAGDEFAVKKEDGVITYLKNGDVFYTSEVTAPDENLYADFAFGLEGHGFESPAFYKQDIVTSMPSHVNNEPANVFPNPTTGTVHFSAPKTGVVSVYDLSGHKLQTQQADQLEILDLDVPSGMYLLTIEHGNGVDKFMISVE